jgi:hypothetical protein
MVSPHPSDDEASIGEENEGVEILNVCIFLKLYVLYMEVSTIVEL